MPFSILSQADLKIVKLVGKRQLQKIRSCILSHGQSLNSRKVDAEAKIACLLLTTADFDFA